ncbi:MAG: hypothetical protein OXC25_13160 [Thiotrichales bacterium]|nr:hypothetical protein [Thiotrichales bacterium]
MKRLTLTLAAGLAAMAISAPAVAQDIQAAADASMVLNNQAKGIANGAVLTTAIPGSSTSTPILSTGYFGGGEKGAPSDIQGPDRIGTLGLGGGRKCPFVNAHRQEATYTPGSAFTVRSCGIMGGPGSFWVGVRVYGVICAVDAPTDCQTLESGSLANPERYETGGYTALLKPGVECSQEKWPTEALRRAGAPAYADWCDYGVLVSP